MKIQSICDVRCLYTKKLQICGVISLEKRFHNQIINQAKQSSLIITHRKQPQQSSINNAHFINECLKALVRSNVP